MSQENVETVRAVDDGWLGGLQGCRRAVRAGFLLGPARRGGRAGSRRGPEVRDALRNLFDIYDDYRVDASESIDGGDEVVVVARSKGTAKASVLELDQLFVFVWTVQAGRLAGLRVVTDA